MRLDPSDQRSNIRRYPRRGRKTRWIVGGQFVDDRQPCVDRGAVLCIDRTINGSAEARAKVDELARELGFSLDELAEAAPTRKRAASAPKYRHPENAEITWSGRGRKPAWIAEALASGKSLGDFAI
jgi:hypothetical protein